MHITLRVYYDAKALFLHILLLTENISRVAYFSVFRMCSFSICRTTNSKCYPTCCLNKCQVSGKYSCMETHGNARVICSGCISGWGKAESTGLIRLKIRQLDSAISFCDCASVIKNQISLLMVVLRLPRVWLSFAWRKKH